MLRRTDLETELLSTIPFAQLALEDLRPCRIIYNPNIFKELAWRYVPTYYSAPRSYQKAHMCYYAPNSRSWYYCEFLLVSLSRWCDWLSLGYQL